jgi:hypothetical protein
MGKDDEGRILDVYFYAYAICRIKPGMPFKRQIKGHKIVMVIFNELALVVESIDKGKREDSLENILLHEQIVEVVSRIYSLLPIQFGMILKDKKEAEEILIRNYNLLLKEITQLEGQIELGVKIFWDQTKLEDYEPIMPEKGVVLTDNKALDYMFKLKNKYKSNDKTNTAYHLTEELNKRFLEIATKGLYRTLRTAELLFDGTYLLSRNDISLFSKTVEKVEADFSGLSILATGPWPPYSFCNLDLSKEVLL